MTRDYDIRFMPLGQVKEKQYILIDGVICKIDTIAKSKPGKHGAAKVRLTATAVFTGSKMNLLKPSNEDIEVPILDKGNAQIIADLGEKYQVMDTQNYQTLEVDKDEFTNLLPGSEIEYLKAGTLIKISRKK